MVVNPNLAVTLAIGIVDLIRNVQKAKGADTTKLDQAYDHLVSANTLLEDENLSLSQQFVEEEEQREQE